MSQSRNDIPRRAEITIVGAGVMGLSLAFELTARGRDVLVLDRGDLAGTATPAAAGMLAPVAESFVGRRAFEDDELPFPESVASLMIAGLADRQIAEQGADDLTINASPNSVVQGSA